MTAARGIPEPVATRLSDGRFELRRGQWSGRYPWSDLDGWLAFYRRLRDRGHPASVRVHGPVVQELERLKAEHPATGS